jgi:hypothetical protein
MADNQQTSAPAGNQQDAQGRRVRLRPKPAAIAQVIGSSPLLAPLKSTNGMVWPYTPTINYQQETDYQQVDMVHTNQEFYAYKKTPATKLTCEGEFSVQNQTEGLYALACINYLRTVTKMYFGQGQNLGTPPPVLLFDAYGPYMFNALPVIVTSFSANMPKEVDYVPINMNNLGKFIVQSLPEPVRGRQTLSSQEGYVWLPAVFNISVSMTVQNTPSKLRQFNLNEFRNGTLLKGGGWI